MEILSIRTPNWKYAQPSPDREGAVPPAHARGSVSGLVARKLPIWIVAVLLAFFTIFPLTAQLQQSGGGGSNASVGAVHSAAPSSGTLVGATYNTSPPTYDNGDMGSLQMDASGNLKIAALPAGSNIIGKVQIDTGQTVGIAAGTNLIGYTRPGNACGTTNYEAGLQYLPNSSTQVSATATCVAFVFFNNTDSAAH